MKKKKNMYKFLFPTDLRFPQKNEYDSDRIDRNYIGDEFPMMADVKPILLRDLINGTMFVMDSDIKSQFPFKVLEKCKFSRGHGSSVRLCQNVKGENVNKSCNANKDIYS